ncbi:MAG: HNH endonuclease signature motif containing protein [Oligoflexia bacterium]|nr:HNH endonuclease signature motif containing protein [Oligoflexia bacterium]
MTTEIPHHLREIESRKLFCALGFSSPFEYAVKELGYSESAALLRIDSMRLLKELPHVEAQIQSLEGKSSRESDRALLALSPEPEKHRPESVRPVSSELSEVRFLASDELLKDLEKLKGLLAHKYPDMNFSDLISYLSKAALKDLDPAQRQVRDKCSPIASEVKPATRPDGVRQAIPAEVQRQVWQRDGSRCTFIHPETGRRCESRFRLQIDHIIPVKLKGSNDLSNLRILCREHNAWEAARVYGISKIRPFWVKRS